MKTTVEIPDELFRAAKSKAALDGRKLKDLVAEGLSLVLHPPTPQALRFAHFPVIRSKERSALSAKQVVSALESEWQKEAKQIAKSFSKFKGLSLHLLS